jgi:hypothetical protein
LLDSIAKSLLPSNIIQQLLQTARQGLVLVCEHVWVHQILHILIERSNLANNFVRQGFQLSCNLLLCF